MARPEKTVFISYRRKDVSWALAVYEYLTNHDFDVFFDYESIQSGDFEQIIVANIKARAHFLLILTPTALDRCSEPGDWLRREIETAISERRNIIPLFFDDFDFAVPSVSDKLTGKLENLKRYNGLEVPAGYFVEAMERLCDRYLNVSLDAVLQPVSEEVQKVVKQHQVAANRAILHKGEHEQNTGKVSETLIEQPGKVPETLVEQPGKETELEAAVASEGGNSRSTSLDTPADQASSQINVPEVEPAPRNNFLLVGIGVIGFLALLLGYFGANYIFQNWPIANVPTVTLLVQTSIPDTEFTSTIPASTPTLVPPEATPTLGTGSTLISEKDGMMMVYIPAGEFQMGSDSGELDERPIHAVSLDAYWIDQTEVSNAMYANCVKDGKCDPPLSNNSSTRDSYYDNPEFNSYPVIYVSWNAADTYCKWAGRRLPSEAEWEKAAGWDPDSQTHRLYPWGDAALDSAKANFCDINCNRDVRNSEYDDGYADTAPVGSYPAGASYYGAYDMAGNVWEWVSDWYDFYPGGDPTASDNFGQTYRVARGSSWFFPIEIASTSNRVPVKPAEPNDAIGFRCAVSAS